MNLKNNIAVPCVPTPRLAAAGLLLLLMSCVSTAADDTGVGVVVMHGKWGSPQGPVNTLADTLQRQGFLVANPEMPWSGRRRYDKSVEAADAEIDAEIAKLRGRGAKQIFLVGHSLGAGYALHFASRAMVDGVVAIAPGHRPESKVFTDLLINDINKARELASSGKGDETISFTDINTGNRRDRIQAGVTSFLSYFDPDGQMNMARNVTTVGRGIPVLWMVPVREEQPARDFVVSYYSKLPPNPGNKFAEPNSDHMNAPAAATSQVIDWIRSTATRK